LDSRAHGARAAKGAPVHSAPRPYFHEEFFGIRIGKASLTTSERAIAAMRRQAPGRAFRKLGRRVGQAAFQTRDVAGGSVIDVSGLGPGAGLK
jgi:hypothetical protein